MLSSELIKPLAVQTPFAINGNKNIPSQNATGTDTSSINLGFLPITSEPLDDGGIAPERIDFNGMFYLSTDQRAYLQNGGYITYDPDVATVIGGYPQGAILNYLDSSGNFSQVRSLVDNNQYNFITTPSYINGVYWQYVSGKPTVISVLETIYPVGAIFIGTTSTCPMAAIFGTWTLVAQDRCLQGASTNYAPNTTIAASLPNITGSNTYPAQNDNTTTSYVSGAFYLANSRSRRLQSESGTGKRLYFDASRSNTLYGGAVLQPSAYVVNVWRRTA